MNKILFISTNNGSDMRINKEIKTLADKAEVYYLGVGVYNSQNYCKPFCKEFYLIEEKRNSIKAIFKQIRLFLKLIRRNKFDSIHIINEQLMIFFYPWLFKQFIVLDIFDSFFLRINHPNDKLKLLKKIIYAPVDKVLVTDLNRFNLMPVFLRDKLVVVENYPYKFFGNLTKQNKDLTILYNGTMNRGRGTDILTTLLKINIDLKVIMIGWIMDDDTLTLSKSNSVDFRGVRTQFEAAVIAASEADYIMCCYEPSNINNINASPNKIFDAIQTRTPLIINREVKVSQFVQTENIGILIDSFNNYDSEKLNQELIERKNSFSFNDQSSDKYSWENIESKLLLVHNL